MIAILAALAIAAGCDLERPSGAPGCRRADIDRTVRMNQMQVIGTHNSYKRAIDPTDLSLIASARGKDADGIDYSHPPLTEQLDAGARVLELDVYLDPQGGRYADPLIRRMNPRSAPYDFDALKQPGLKVFHIQDWDYRSNCILFTQCLAQIRAWSKAHPDHVPILITLNFKDEKSKTPGTVVPLPFDAAAMDSVDAEIRSVFRAGEVITPDALQGRRPTLRDAARAAAWPTLGRSRGKVLFAVDEGPEKVAVYRGTRRSLEGREMFVYTDEASPAGAYITLNEPIEDAERIGKAVAAGYLVRTRADADTREARTGDTHRREAAFASGAQFISTDYMRPDPRLGPYQVSMPGGVVARIRPDLAR